MTFSTNNTSEPTDEYSNTALYVPLIVTSFLIILFGCIWITDKLKKICQRNHPDNVSDGFDEGINYDIMSPNETLTQENLARFQAQLQNSQSDNSNIASPPPSRLIINTLNGYESPSPSLLTPHTYVSSEDTRSVRLT